MTNSVSAREANQHFSNLLGRAARGERIVITRRGTPVAELAPCKGDGKGGAWDRLLGILETGLALGGDAFDRDALYDR